MLERDDLGVALCLGGGEEEESVDVKLRRSEMMVGIQDEKHVVFLPSAVVYERLRF